LVCVTNSENLASASQKRLLFLELEITLVKFFIVLLDFAAFHDLHLFIGCENLHDFKDIYRTLLG